MRLYLGSDHAGYRLKNVLKEYVEGLGHETTDLGVFEGGTRDYPEIAREVSEKVYENSGSLGVLVCGSGTGMCMAANKQKGIRAAACTNETLARYARAHNDANVICMGERIVGEEVAKSMLKVFLETPFDGGRHEARVNKINEMDHE